MRGCTKRFRRNMRKLWDLTQRKFKSDYHEKAWGGFEKALYLRTMGFLLTRNFLAVMMLLTNKERYDYTELVFKDENSKINLELAQDIFPVAKTLHSILLISRFTLFITALKWWKLAKFSFYIEIALMMVETFLPVKESINFELLFTQLNLYMTFWLSYWKFWPDLICSLVGLVPFYVNRVVLNGDD